MYRFPVTEKTAFFPILGEKHRYIFDKSVVAKQMSVVEAFGLLLFRVDKGKEFHSSKLYVFRLTDFEEEDDEPKTRQFCKNHRVDKSKGNVTENTANYTIKLNTSIKRNKVLKVLKFLKFSSS